MCIPSRIKEVRKFLGLTQEEFGDKLGLSRSMVVNLEMGKLKNDDQVRRYCRSISSILQVNETWLLTGEGEMKSPPTREQEIASMVQKLYGSDPNSFEYKVAKYLSEMQKEDWEAFRRFVKSIADSTDL